MGKTQLPPGLRFHPTDVELVKYYLKRKVLGKKHHFQGIVELDIYKHAPWDLPDKSGWRSGDLKWYFFCPREKKYATGGRMNRSTDVGYWKTTGKDRPVSYNHEVVGWIKTLVFHRGKAPKGDRTDWVMYEYRLEEKKLAEKGVVQDAYVLCAIFKKDGPGPRNGAQYGAPFREEDWDDDDEKGEEVDGGQAVLSADMFAPAFVMPVSQNCSVPSSSIFSEINGETSMVSCPVAVASAPNLPPLVSDNAAATLETGQPMHGDEIVKMLSIFSDEGVAPPLESDKNEMVDCPNNSRHVQPNPFSDGLDIYDNLADLGSLAEWGEPGENIINFCVSPFHKEPMLQPDDIMELVDLDVPLDISTEPQGYSHVQAGDLCSSNNFCNTSGNSHAQAGGLCAGNNFCNTYGNGHAQAGVLNACHNLCNTSGNLFCPDNSCFASSLVNPYSLASQLPGASYALDHQSCVSSQRDGTGGAAAISNRGYDVLESGSYPGNTPVIQSAQPEQSERRGQQRISCSKLQYRWEPVRSFVFKEHRALSLDDGSSSIHVKAEVTTLWSDGCTKDALSDKLGEFPFVQLNICATTFVEKGGGGFVWQHTNIFLLLLPTTSPCNPCGWVRPYVVPCK